MEEAEYFSLDECFYSANENESENESQNENELNNNAWIVTWKSSMFIPIRYVAMNCSDKNQEIDLNYFSSRISWPLWKQNIVPYDKFRLVASPGHGFLDIN